MNPLRSWTNAAAVALAATLLHAQDGSAPRAPAHGAEAPPAVSPSVPPAAGAASNQEPAIPDEDLRMVFDKGKIAEEGYRRIVGLEEAGRPHIVKGTVLEGARTDPEAVQVDLEALRQRTIALCETRMYDPSPIAASDPGPGPEPVPVPRGRPAADGRLFGQWVAASCLVGIGLLLALYMKFAFRPKRPEPPKPAERPRRRAYPRVPVRPRAE